MKEYVEPHTSKEELNTLVKHWFEYIEANFPSTYTNKLRSDLEPTRQRLIRAGYAQEEPTEEAELLLEMVSVTAAVEDQREQLRINTKRLQTLARLAGKKTQELRGSTVVSIGGGPGDQIIEPWFPRVAAVVGAHVINFDYSEEHPVDKDLELYTHIGGHRGNIFRLLTNDQTLSDELKDQKDITIIECNNLLGNNVSPSLAIDLYTLSHPERHPKIIEMRNNLIAAANMLLAPGGVLAIDNAYWRKDGDVLLPIDENGTRRETAIFPGEIL